MSCEFFVVEMCNVLFRLFLNVKEIVAPKKIESLERLAEEIIADQVCLKIAY